MRIGAETIPCSALLMRAKPHQTWATAQRRSRQCRGLAFELLRIIEFYALVRACPCACFSDLPLGHTKWFPVPCSEPSLSHRPHTDSLAVHTVWEKRDSLVSYVSRACESTLCTFCSFTPITPRSHALRTTQGSWASLPTRACVVDSLLAAEGSGAVPAT
jgi:hypothetical protein